MKSEYIFKKNIFFKKINLKNLNNLNFIKKKITDKLNRILNIIKFNNNKKKS